MLLGEGVAAAGGGDDGVDQVRVVVEGLAGGGEDQLGVGRGAVAVDLEDADGDALAPQGHSLGVPEAGGGVDLARRPGRRRR